ncbi:aromatic ring-hydroxylating dioxygenase subunit alpha [Paraburkholderia sp. CNPSo 3272]|uniref:aromatic ring-hydroxylating oxygenase subunit alpha n=1 Tax=Paraburkholderia sp. CNPSo 3272 TaxID=2940931 RepID=UPI0020B7C254|nr:aromatic ring-hydroxylating dioxygenase subunit alpha [Paraburkholderia sp. CNPSo 3272]MCP3723947.1 aromatic ring-hydroxylating dioxygenase subunit alpha [Paraburkholderia sp. CNPSo 3272]
MTRYRDDAGAIHALVQEDRVHRDVYLSEELFRLEQERLFQRSWNYVGHESQVPEPGDYYTTEIAGQPLILVRQPDHSLRVLMNRCAHKGARLVCQVQGNTGRVFRCPYHAWAYKTDGALLAVPLKSGYEHTRMAACESGAGLVAPRMAVYRGFVFTCLSADGPEFADYLGPVLTVLDSLADRSPAGQLQIAGGCLRSVMRCNWKMYLENVNDSVHPVSTHESVSATARAVHGAQPADAPESMALQQLLPFGSGYDFFTRTGARIYPNGHSVLGIRASIHSEYEVPATYRQALEAAHGAQRTAEVLGFAPQNVVLFPSLALKGTPQTLRVVKPLGVDRTLVEVWALAPKGAPQALLERTLTYNRLTFSPMSVVAHDDIHIFEGVQRSLAAQGNPWISLHREYRDGEQLEPEQEVSGTNELLMRNQFRAWATLMTADAKGAST